MSLAASLPDIGGQPSLGSIFDRPVPSAGPVRAPTLGDDACLKSLGSIFDRPVPSAGPVRGPDSRGRCVPTIARFDFRPTSPVCRTGARPDSRGRCVPRIYSGYSRERKANPQDTGRPALHALRSGFFIATTVAPPLPSKAAAMRLPIDSVARRSGSLSRWA